MSNGWIGVDLDGTLAHYDGWKGVTHIGRPIAAMVDRGKLWLAEGREVRIFTARVFHDGTPERTLEVAAARYAIRDWTEEHIGVRMDVTNIKDFRMIELWDDRAIRLIPNTGEPCCAGEKSQLCL